jgi:hypothetical protein
VIILHAILPCVAFNLKTAGGCPDPLPNLSSSHPPNTTQRCYCGGVSPRRPNAAVLRGETVICVFSLLPGFPGGVLNGGRCAALFPFCVAYFFSRERDEAGPGSRAESGSGLRPGSRTGSGPRSRSGSGSAFFAVGMGRGWELGGGGLISQQPGARIGRTVVGGLSFKNLVFKGGLGNFSFFHAGGKLFFHFLVVFCYLLDSTKPITAG